MREDTRAEDAGHRRPGTTHPAMHRADRADGADGIEATDGTGAPKHSNGAYPHRHSAAGTRHYHRIITGQARQAQQSQRARPGADNNILLAGINELTGASRPC